MNKYQTNESRTLKFLIKNWWMAANEPYKRFRRYMRKLQRDTIKKNK